MDKGHSFINKNQTLLILQRGVMVETREDFQCGNKSIYA